MASIEFSSDEKDILARKLQLYFREELDQDIGQFDAGFLLDFISEEIGSYYYNRGLYDARTVVESNLARIDEELYEIERPTDFRK